MYIGRSVVTLSLKRVRIERQNAPSFPQENELVILASVLTKSPLVVFRSDATTEPMLNFNNGQQSSAMEVLTLANGTPGLFSLFHLIS